MTKERHEKGDPTSIGEHHGVDVAKPCSKRGFCHAKTLTLAAFVVFSACGPTSRTEELLSGTWALQSFELPGGTVSVSHPDHYTLDLGPDGKAGVRADCNSCGGSYRLEGSRLTFGLMACTLIACPTGSLDADYLRALGSASSFEIRNGELFLRYAGGVLRFRQV